MIPIIDTYFYNRSEVEADKNSLYIFTDNTDRTSGRNFIDKNSWYYKKYSRNFKLCYPNQTSAVIRGLNNAYPISTQKEYLAKRREAGRWFDFHFDIFKDIIDEEVNDIITALDSGKYNKLYIPKGGFFNRTISMINEQRTPKIYRYLLNSLNFIYSVANG